MKQIKVLRRNLCAIVYYGFAQYLPRSAAPCGKLWKMIRGSVVRGMLAEAGYGVDVESHAYIGKGTNIRVGNNSGIGYRCLSTG